MWRGWILPGRGGNAVAGCRLPSAGQHQLGGWDSGWREGEQVLASAGVLVVTARRPRASCLTEAHLKPRPVPHRGEKTERPARDDSVLVPRAAARPGSKCRKRGKDADEMCPIDPS